jgi:hypothetical protein
MSDELKEANRQLSMIRDRIFVAGAELAGLRSREHILETRRNHIYACESEKMNLQCDWEDGKITRVEYKKALKALKEEYGL